MFLKNKIVILIICVFYFAPLLAVGSQISTLIKPEEQGIAEQDLLVSQATTNSQAEIDMPDIITEEEITLLARAVYSEARGEPFQGQVAIAAVILNRVDHEDFPDDIRGVIMQPAAFTAIQDGQFWLYPDATAFAAVEEALSGNDPSCGAIYYYNPATATSAWIYSRRVITAIGKHSFAI